MESDAEKHKGPCIALEGDKEVAWLYVDSSGNYVPFDDDGALYVLTEIHQDREPHE